MSDLLLNLLPPPPPPPDAQSRRRRRRHMNSPGPSPHDLQSHLYQSFLDGKTTDVALRISGSWHAIYHLHRVVLIQSVSSFFLINGQYQYLSLARVSSGLSSLQASPSRRLPGHRDGNRHRRSCKSCSTTTTLPGPVRLIHTTTERGLISVLCSIRVCPRVTIVI